MRPPNVSFVSHEMNDTTDENKAVIWLFSIATHGWTTLCFKWFYCLLYTIDLINAYNQFKVVLCFLWNERYNRWILGGLAYSRNHCVPVKFFIYFFFEREREREREINCQIPLLNASIQFQHTQISNNTNVKIKTTAVTVAIGDKKKSSID